MRRALLIHCPSAPLLAAYLIVPFRQQLIPQMQNFIRYLSSFFSNIIHSFTSCLSANRPSLASMPFELSIVTKEEMQDVVEMLFYAYDESSAFVNAVYPHRITKEGIEGLEMVVARLQYLIDIDPSIRWYKVTDSNTGEIVSASQWNVYDKEKPPEMMLDGPPGSWATDADKKYAIDMFESFIMPRYTRYRQVDLPIICESENEFQVKLSLSHIGLNIMGTAKKYQHKGAATVQVKNFTALADELNAIVRRLCARSIDLCLHPYLSDYYRINHRRPLAV
jgi:hypothetical protein